MAHGLSFPALWNVVFKNRQMEDLELYIDKWWTWNCFSDSIISATCFDSSGTILRLWLAAIPKTVGHVKENESLKKSYYPPKQSVLPFSWSPSSSSRREDSPWSPLGWGEMKLFFQKNSDFFRRVRIFLSYRYEHFRLII